MFTPLKTHAHTDKIFPSARGVLGATERPFSRAF